jgi:POT family proton-dependent oligopeptide transporter
MAKHTSALESPTLFGHPAGLFTLFFAEMWERFSYYGMRALLLFYMLKGFLGQGENGYVDEDAYAVYGAYTALVYMTPFFGGMIADRLLGQRRAVILGGLLMAAGHLMMTVENRTAFFTALALLICGNGFFKPNISTMVGALYRQGSPRRDGGFTIFYMGINLGAGMAPLLCGYIGETYGWHYGFGLATIGMLTGVAVFTASSLLSQITLAALAVASAVNIFFIPEIAGEGSNLPTISSMAILLCLPIAGAIAVNGLRREGGQSPLNTLAARVLIMAGAVAAAWALWRYHPDNIYSTTVNVFVAISLLAAGVVAWIALGRGGLPDEVGAPPDQARLRDRRFGLSSEWLVYLGALFAVPVFAVLVSGFAPLRSDGKSIVLIPQETIDSMSEKGGFGEVAATVLAETSKPAGLILFLAGIGAILYLAMATSRFDRVARQRLYVAFILTFFSMLFWAFFEQAGSSINNFTDRNVDRIVGEARVIDAADIGASLTIQPTQAQLGYHNGETLFTIDVLDDLREENTADPEFTTTWTIAPDNVGMLVVDRASEIPASPFQSVNPVCILIFGLMFTALWGFLASRNLEPSTPVKFSLGLLQLGLGFGALWYGAEQSDGRGMVAVSWLLLGYVLHTTGELCLSPVGLSMITKLSPKVLVSTMMGVWFLATAFSQFLAAIIAQFTGVGHGGDGEGSVPPPVETVSIYGDVFGQIALTAIVSSLVCFALSPILKRWMHEDLRAEEATSRMH